MSERLLVSPSPFLSALSKEMRYRLDNYPILAFKEEKVDYYYTKFQLLFTGSYRSITFQTDLLNTCVMQFLECVMIFVRDHVDLDNRGINNVKKWFGIIDNLGGIDSIKNKLMFFKPILQNPVLQQLPIWFSREFLLHLNRLFEFHTELIFTNGRDIQFLLRTVKKWMKIIMESGDYEYQVVLVEIIINTCEERHLDEIFERSDDLTFLKRMFLKVHSRIDYVNDLEALLSTINNIFQRVRSIPCLNVTLEDRVIPPSKGGGDNTWMHINYGVHTLSFNCDRNSLRSLPGSQSLSNFNEFVTVNFEDINKIGLLINNDCEGVNTVGGIFLMNISGQCSCRFDSSKETVCSIKKILLKVSEGVHLNFLKNEFSKIFGNRFKLENKISKKNRNLLEKKNSISSLLSHNLSFNTENRRESYMKGNASIASNPENLLTQDCKFDNSLTLENKENNLEDGSNSSLISTGTRFSTPVGTKNKVTTNLQKCKSMSHNFRSMTPSSSNHLMPEKIKNKVLKVKDAKSISPCTATKELISDSKTAQHSTNKVFTAKKERRCGNATKSLEVLKNSKVDILTTSKNEEQILETFEIVPTSSLEIKQEDNKFDEECSYTILKGDQSSILDFINSELDSIPELQSPVLKNESTKNKISKMNLDSSVSKTSSGTNNYELGLDVNLAASSTKITTLDNSNKPKGKNTTRMENRNTLRLLNSSEEAGAEDFKNSEIEVIDDNIPNVKNNGKEKQRRNLLSMKLNMPDSYTFQNKEEILTRSKKFHGIQDLLSRTINKKPINIDQRDTLENAEAINKKVIDNETEKEGESEYYSINEDVSLTNDNTATPDLYFENKSEKTKISPTHPLKELMKMNSEEIVNISVESKVNENDDLVTLQHQVFRDEESQYYSINPDEAQIENNSETPNLDFHNTELQKLTKFDHSKNKPDTIEKNENNCFLLDEQASEYYSCDPAMIVSENNEVYDGIRNSETPEINLNKGVIQKNDNLIINDYNSDLVEVKSNSENVNKKASSIDIDLSAETVKIDKWYFPKNIPDDLISEIITSESNAKPERDFDNISIISISSTEESDSDVEFPDNPIEEQASESYSCDPAVIKSENNEVYDGICNSETPEMNFNKGVIQKNDNLIINDYKSDLVEAKSKSENVNKKASSIDIDLSAETVKIDKWYFPKNIPDDLISEIITSESNAKPERDFDNISIISISSTGESDSDVEFPDNPIEEQASESYSCDPAMIKSENNEVYDGICNSETPEMNFNKGVIQKNDNLIINDYNSDLVKAKCNSENVIKEASSIVMDLSAQTVKIDKWHFPKNIPDDLISEIITSESNEKPERDFDNISIISISSTEESDSDVEFPDNPIEEQASESYSCDPAMIKSENNEVYDGICNSETPEMNFNKGVIQKNDNLIINDYNSDLVEAKSNSENVNKEASSIVMDLSAQTVKIDKWYFPKNIPDDLISEIITSESNEKPERDFDNISIIYISSTEESDSDVEFPDNSIEEQASESYSCDPAMIKSENNEVYDGICNSETPEMNFNKGVIQKNDNLIINDYNSDLVEAKSNSENVNKEASSIVMDLSAQTVKIDKWHFPKNIPDDLISEIITSESNEKRERDFDNISIISISSTEESDSDVEFPDNPIEVKDTNDYLHMSDIEQNLFVNEIEMEEIPISEITESVRNDHCYSFNQGSQTKIDEDNLIECDANKINEFDDIDPLNCELIQSTQKSDQSLKNDAFDLNKTNSDVPLTCLVSENLEILDKGCKNIENLQNAITSTFTSMEHNSSQVACNEQHKSSNVAVAQNKVNILSNIRIAPPLCNKFNQSNNDFQLLNDKYVAAVNDLQNYKNELARAREHIQQLEAFERNNKEAAELTGNFETKKRLSDTPVTGNAEKKSKLTQEERKSKANDLEMMEVENGEVDHLREFVSIGKTSEKSVGKSKAEKNKLIDVQLTPRTYKSKEINENMNFNQQFDAFIKATLLDKVEPVKERKLIRKVQSISTKQKSKGNFEKLEVINEEDLGLATNKTIPRANEFNKKIDLDFDNFKMEKENDDLYNVIRKPQRSLKKSDKTGEANKTREIQRDEEYYQHVDSMYGFDAMLYALSSYLATWPEKKFKKPRKKNTRKIVLRLRKNARNKSKNKKYGKLF